MTSGQNFVAKPLKALPVSVSRCPESQGALNRLAASGLICLSLGLAGPACGPNEPEDDAIDSSFVAEEGKADTGGIAENSYEAVCVLKLTNAASLTVLDSAAPGGVGLTSTTAANINSYKVGADGKVGTTDDAQFNTLKQLDDVPYVGPVSFGKLLTYAKANDYCAHPPNSTCITGPFCMSDLQDQILKLGYTGTIQGSVTASGTYAGTVKLTIHRADLDTATNQTDMPITVVPDTITLKAAETLPFTVTVKANINVADVSGKSFMVHGQDMPMTGPTLVADSKPVKVTTSPVLEIEVFQTGKTGDLHVWKIDGAVLQLGSLAPKVTFKARAASGGTTVKIFNRDTTFSHIWHCGGQLIPHQNVASQGTAPNASYDNVVTKTGTDACYDHNLDNSFRAVQLLSE